MLERLGGRNRRWGRGLLRWRRRRGLLLRGRRRLLHGGSGLAGNRLSGGGVDLLEIREVLLRQRDRAVDKAEYTGSKNRHELRLKFKLLDLACLIPIGGYAAFLCICRLLQCGRRDSGPADHTLEPWDWNL